MRWASPRIFLAILILLPVLLSLLLMAWNRRRTLLKRFANPHLWNVVAPGYRVRRDLLRSMILFLAVALGLIALARPQFGFEWENVKRTGVDILVAFDVSDSMLAQDVEPSRLERARREVVDLLSLLRGDRIGLIAFAGVPYLQCPLTLDYGVIPLFLDDLNPDLIPVPGTGIGDAIRLATKVFEKQGGKSRALILITDGEDHGGNPVEAAKSAKEAGVRIFAIGIGQEGGAPIPEVEGGGFRKDERGNLIVSKLDEDTLKKIAEETGGTYVRSVSGDLDLERIYNEEIRSNLEQSEMAGGRKRKWEERYQWFLLVSVLLLAGEWWITVPSSRRRDTESV